MIANTQVFGATAPVICADLELVEKYQIQLQQELHDTQQELKKVLDVGCYTAEIKHKKVKLAERINEIEKTQLECTAMFNIPPGSWVCNGTSTPGKVIHLKIAGRIPEAHVQWWGHTVPIPERPSKLSLIEPDSLEYEWNGERFPKLIRKCDRIECEEVEVLEAELESLRTEDSSLRDTQLKITYCTKKIEWTNNQDLYRLERVIKQGIDIFYRVGEALMEIRDRKLYKDLGYSNFRDYCDSRWNMKKSRAYQLIESAAVMNNLESVHHGGQNLPTAYQTEGERLDLIIDRLPDSERITRELAKAPSCKQAEVWNKALEKYGDNPTAKQVKSVVAEIKAEELKDVGLNSSRDKQDTALGNQALVKQFEIGQLVKLELNSFDGVSENLKLANHSYGQITSVTETGHGFNVSVLGHKSFVVFPQDIKPVDSVNFCVEFTPKQFLNLMSVYQSRAGIENAIKEGVLKN